MTLPVFTDGLLTNAAALTALGNSVNSLSVMKLGAPPPRSYVPQVKMTVNTQSIPSGVITLIAWNTALTNNDSMWSSGAPSQFTIQTPGTYSVELEMGWGFQSPTSGGVTVWGLLNGTSTVLNSVCLDEQAATSWIHFTRGNTQHASIILPGLVNGNTFFIAVKQNSGAGTFTSGAPLPSLSLWRVGP